MPRILWCLLAVVAVVAGGCSGGSRLVYKRNQELLDLGNNKTSLNILRPRGPQ